MIGEEIGANGGLDDLVRVLSCQTLFVELLGYLAITVKMTRISEEECTVQLDRSNGDRSIGKRTRTIRVSASAIDQWKVIRENSDSIAQMLVDLLGAEL